MQHCPQYASPLEVSPCPQPRGEGSMRDTRVLVFPPFRLDLGAERLWRDTQAVRLTAKAFAVLRYLVAHAGQLVTKDELIDAIWACPAVSEAALTVCIGEIRRALGETARTPQFLETVRGRGYRFGASVLVASPAPGPLVVPAPPPGVVRPPAHVVGREAELAQLQQGWQATLRGQRQIVLVTGEAGIGKTTLVDAAVAHLGTAATVWSIRGQCIEQYGAGEAYMPLLEALGQLRRGPDGTRLIALLQQYAPSWLVQLPELLSPTEMEGLQQRSGSMTRERMLRELVVAIEALSVERPLLLVLEDLQWSDDATIDWLTLVARRRAEARLLLPGTYRPAEAVQRGHPIHTMTQELQRQGQGLELRLGALSADGVQAYLAQRFGALACPQGLVHLLHQRTSGNPFFLVTVVDELVRQGTLVFQAESRSLQWDLRTWALGIPQSVRQLIEQQLAQVGERAQTMLEVASVVGLEFSAGAVAAVMGHTAEDVEACCDTLARRGQCIRLGDITEWPDGTVAMGYSFIHSLYPEVIYERVPVSRRVRWHRQIGLHLEASYGPQARELAVALAEHFVRGRDPERAVPYLQAAGAQAVQRSAHQEALRHLTQARELLATLPKTPARLQQELDVQLALGSVFIATRGPGAPEVEQTYGRARVLCTQLGEPPQLFATLRGLCRFYRGTGVLPAARALGEQLYRLAQQAHEPLHLLEAHDALGGTLFYLGEYTAARPYLEQGIALANAAAQAPLLLQHGVALGVRCLAMAAWTLWCLGYPEQAVQRSQEALAQAQTLDHPYSLALARTYAICLAHHRRDIVTAQGQAAALLPLARAHGFPLWIGYGTFWQGWVAAMHHCPARGLEQMLQGLQAIVASGQTVSRPLCLLLCAEVAGSHGRSEEGLRLLAEAMAVLAANGRGDLLAEGYRLQGELLLRQPSPDVSHAEACFQQALTIARTQQARSWELRAAMSLSRLWWQQGQRAEAAALLAPIYGWFTEGFDTADLQEAKTLLEALEG
jgi:DNA-binding winged helix-turn-helix (wHTH) protein/predicted ATPase